MRTSKKKRVSAFDVVVTLIMVLLTLIIVYPLYYTVIASFSSPNEVAAGNTLLWVKDFSTVAYKQVVKEKDLWIGYRNTFFYTLFGTAYQLALTLPAAYVLTKKSLPFRGVISWYFFITMYISGGLVPSYLLMKNLHLINNPLVMILGSGVYCYNLILTRQFFSESIPGELYESVYIDGASDWTAFTKIALPLAKPIIAVMTLYYGVGKWNSYYTGLIYLYKEKYFTLQQMLRKILLMQQTMNITEGMDNESVMALVERFNLAKSMKYAVIFISCLPLMIAYPFAQKYFVQGVMIGSVKG